MQLKAGDGHLLQLLSAAKPDDLRLISVHLQPVAAHPVVDLRQAGNKSAGGRISTDSGDAEIKLSVVGIRVCLKTVPCCNPEETSCV